jgi:hypothetical protein
VKGNQISPRQLSLSVALHIPNIAFVDQVDIGNIVEIYDAGSEFSAYGKDDGGVVFLDYELIR